ncbi:hypothetical protein EIP91_011347 [Steccherinum ochraceum]|uniref:C3H1-type domain-containing protein n=1 Tax=Steccherinum ochraceum TaxID=92696 RepID=A0A4R0R843_9APHY|nr:hypothetical protein EIP91_011347 [Steccherinum ochraceum]
MSDNRFRTKLCRNFALGHCAQGDRCKYLHSMNIPVSSPTFTSSQPVTQFVGAPSGFSPPLFSPYNTSSLGYPWGLPSPTAVQSPDQMQFNWTYTSSYPPPALPPPPPQPQYQPHTQGTSPPNPPQFRPLSWRTTLCRHFSKNQGWCPLGDECGYIHDLALAAHASDDIRFPNQYRSERGSSDVRGKSAAKGRAGSKHSHCWAYVQGLCRVKDCPYLHPAAINLFVPHTPCLAWPNCTRGSLCAYKHPESLPAKASEPAPRPIQSQIPMQPQPVPQPPSPVLFIPSSSVQFHGTTYFPFAPPQQPYSFTHAHHVAPPIPPPPPPPPPPPAPQSSPHYTWYSPVAGSVPSGYSPYSPESLPFHSPAYAPRGGLPPISIAGSMNGPTYDESIMYPGMRAPISTGADATSADPSAIDDVPAKQPQPGSEPHIEEFPYQPPPPTQRHGHARRISVTLKSKDDSDALGLTTSQGSVRHGRESWMVHSQRDGPTHRSWPWISEAFGAPQSTASQNPGMV